MTVVRKPVYQEMKVNALLFVVWRGIYNPGQTQQKDGDRGFILLPPQPAVLSRSDAGRDGVEPASCFVIPNC